MDFGPLLEKAQPESAADSPFFLGALRALAVNRFDRSLVGGFYREERKGREEWVEWTQRGRSHFSETLIWTTRPCVPTRNAGTRKSRVLRCWRLLIFSASAWRAQGDPSLLRHPRRPDRRSRLPLRHRSACRGNYRL